MTGSEKHDQIKHRIQICEEECETLEKIKKYKEDEKKVSDELSMVKEKLKNQFNYPNSLNIQKNNTLLNQTIEEHKKALNYWKIAKKKINKKNR